MAAEDTAAVRHQSAVPAVHFLGCSGHVVEQCPAFSGAALPVRKHVIQAHAAVAPDLTNHAPAEGVEDDGQNKNPARVGTYVRSAIQAEFRELERNQQLRERRGRSGRSTWRRVGGATV